MNDSTGRVAKLETGIAGIDEITLGGLPRARSTVVAGTAGSGKTVLAVQFLAAGISCFESSGVFVTCEEAPDDIRLNAVGHGWDLAEWEATGRWAFVDASPEPGQSATESGQFDLEGLMSRIEHAVARVGATRVAVDSLGALLNRFRDAETVRVELHRIFARMKTLGVTVVMTVERTVEDGAVGRYGSEDFVADNILLLRNRQTGRSRRRTMEVLKFRGADHLKGEWPFSITEGAGLQVVPLGGRESSIEDVDSRTTTGLSDLDNLVSGGVYRGSVILASGATGSGKTLLVTHFVNTEQRAILLSFEENRRELQRNARGWGMDLAGKEARDGLRILSVAAEQYGTDEQLVHLQNAIAEFNPERIVVDGLSALKRAVGDQGVYDFVVGANALVKRNNLTALITSTTSSLLGGESVTEADVSTATDVIILLRYAEVYGTMKRGLTVLKVRGSQHDKEIHEVTIDETGMHIGGAFTNVSGFLSGQVSVITDDELGRMGDMFQGMPR